MNLKLSAVLLGAATILQASATTITFEGTAFSDSSIHYISSYSEQGFTLGSSTGNTGSKFGVIGSTHSWYSGSTALYNNLLGTYSWSVLNRNDGGLFGVQSIDLFEVSKPFTDVQGLQIRGLPSTITFEGFNLGTKVASQTFTIDGLLGGQTVVLNSDFNNLTSFRFNSSASSIYNLSQFDNIVVSAVPDGGSSLALIGVAFGALGFARRFTAKA